MKNDWAEKTIADSWILCNGGAEHPYGDIWRMVLINPIIFGILEKISKERTASIDSKTIYSIIEKYFSYLYLSFNKHYNYKILVNQNLVAFHEKYFSSSEIKNIKILDLGCGEGYIGRMLFGYDISYIGIDSSETFIEYANKELNNSFKNQEKSKKAQIKYYKQDLEAKDEICALLSNLKKEDFVPQLIICNIVLEHLISPENLLLLLRNLYHDSNTIPIILFTTLNYPYFELNDKTDINQRVISTHIDCLDSDDLKVDICLRSHFEIQKLFRDSGIQILDNAKVKFPPQLEDKIDLKGQFRKTKVGIAPFNIYITKFTDGSYLTEIDKQQLLSNRIVKDKLLNLLSETQKQNFLSKISKLDLIEYKKDDKIIHQFNVGGDLFFIVSGKAKITMIYDELFFSEGAIIGEIEYSSVKEYYYIYPVTVLSDKCIVLRIPAKTVSILLGSNNNIEKKILYQMRNGIIFRNLQSNTYEYTLTQKRVHSQTKMSNDNFYMKYSINHHLLNRNVKKILLALENEHLNLNRAKYRNVVHISDIDDKVIRVLFSMHIVECIPNCDFDFIIDKNKYKEIIMESIKYLFCRQDDTFIDKVNNISFEILNMLFWKNICLTRNGVWQSGVNVLKSLNEVKSKIKKISNIDAVELENRFSLWKKFLWNLSFLFSPEFKDCHFLIINDLSALKKIAWLDYETTNEILNKLSNIYKFDDTATLPKLDSFKEYYRNDDMKNRFLRKLCQFIEADLEKNNGKLSYSDVNYNYEYRYSYTEKTKKRPI